jgi:hypothetical protein
MNVLISNKYRVGANHYMVAIRSDLYADVDAQYKVPIASIQNFLHRKNQLLMLRYLRGYVRSRILAYQKVCATSYRGRIEKLNTLLTHLMNAEHGTPLGTYKMVNAWSELLKAVLPKNEDISHEKIEAIIASAEKHYNNLTNDKTRALLKDAREHNASRRLGARARYTERLLQEQG